MTHEIPQFTTLFHLSIYHLPRTPTSAQRVSVCWKRQKTAKRFDQTLRLPSLSVIFLVEVLSMSMVFVTFTVWDNIVSLITNRWSDRPRLVNWWTVALRRRYELRQAKSTMSKFCCECALRVFQSTEVLKDASEARVDLVEKNLTQREKS